MRFWSVLLALGVACGCANYAYTNRRLEGRDDKKVPLRAGLDIRTQRGNQRVLFLLAISGGGSRAAYFSGAAMLALEKVFADINLLHEVDVISAVSGGCLPAAYYCISEDPGVRKGSDRSLAQLTAEFTAKLRLAEKKKKAEAQAEPLDPEVVKAMRLLEQTPSPSGRVWDEATVKDLMSRNYIGSWGRKMFRPRVWCLFFFTAYDRTDMMAEVLSDSLFDFGVTKLGADLEFRHLNPSRPHLVLNATNATANAPKEETFGRVFTFTDDDFRRYLDSDIQRYEVGRAVMASSTFPGVFNYMTLRDYRDADAPRYMHMADGGCSDMLGLESVKKIIIRHHNDYRNIIVLLLDARTDPDGVPRDVDDARKFMDYAIDSNFMDMFDSLLEGGRRQRLDEFSRRIFSVPSREEPLDLRDKMIFCRLSFHSVQDQDQRNALLQIPTNFKISAQDVKRIDAAVPKIVAPDRALLRAIRLVLLNTGPESPSLRGLGGPRRSP